MDENDRGARSAPARHLQNHGHHHQNTPYTPQSYAPLSYGDASYPSDSPEQQQQQHHQQQPPQQQQQSQPPPGSRQQQQQQQQQQSQYSTYSSAVYPPPNHAPYTTPLQTYARPSQSSAIEVLSSQFSGAHVPQYYVSTDASPGGTSQTPQNHHTQNPAFSSPSYTQYTPTNRPVYNSNTPISPSIQQPEPEPAVEDTSGTLDEAYAQYETALKRTFQTMREGRLLEAGDLLLTISEWLLSNSVELGLVRDEQDLHAYRTKLWNEFNTAWLSVLARQRELLNGMQQGVPVVLPMSVIREETLDKMGKELVRLCDNMERHGLVDYQMGVWEEEIIEAIQDCLALLEEMNGGTT